MSLQGFTVDQVIRRVVRSVRARSDNKQDPWTEGSIDEDFYFVAAAPAPVAKPAAPPVLNPLPVAKTTNRPQPGQTIKDCDICPELVVLPRGSFMMGSSDTESQRGIDEGPLHRVTINYDLAVGKYEITQGQWKAVMGSNPSNFKDCGDNCPVEQVRWNDTQEYIKKLNARSGQKYRLLSEAEWEYAARAGTTTPFHTGQTITTDQANFDGNYTYNGSAKGIYRAKTVKIGSFTPNAFGLYDMHGNVFEWVQDVYHASYTGAPENGSVWEREGSEWSHVLRGGSWDKSPWYLRSAGRYRIIPVSPDDGAGFRIAKTF
jgi:formylglycine-generating enzyme required for sulfatase activity